MDFFLFLGCASKYRDLIKEFSVSLDVIAANFLSERTSGETRLLSACCHIDLSNPYSCLSTVDLTLAVFTVDCLLCLGCRV